MNLNIKYNFFIKLASALTVMCLMFVGELNATHIVGGDITYKALGNDQYEVTLTVRRDCELGGDDAQFDDPAIIGIFSSQGSLLKKLGENGLILLPFNDDDTLNTFITSECGFEGTQVCVHETIYKGVVNLPFKAGGYVLTYQRCCRNESINNIVEPLETGSTYDVVISEQALTEGNSSPRFIAWPDIYLCADDSLAFDHSAVDAEGDSLVYKLCVPNGGATIKIPRPSPPSRPPYSKVEYMAPFGLDNLLGGARSPLKIDRATGMLTAMPTLVGQYLIGICVEEYRNGVKIGEVKRDFEYNVRICGLAPVADFILPSNNCDGLTINFENASEDASTYAWNFNYPSEDSTFYATGENPSFTFLEEGEYKVQLLAYRGSDNCADEIIKTISVFNLGYEADFDLSVGGCDDQDSLTINLKDISASNDPEVSTTDVAWSIAQNGVIRMFSGDDLTVKVGQSDFTVTMDVMAGNICASSVSKDIIYNDLIFMPDFTISMISCSTDSTATFTLMDLTQENNPSYKMVSFEWKVIVGTDTVNLTGPNPFFEIPRENFEVVLIATADDNCRASISKAFNIEDFFPEVDFTYTLLNCDDANNAVIQFSEKIDESALSVAIVSYIWTIDEMTFEGQSIDVALNKDVVLATLTVELENGCSAVITKEILVNELRPRPRFIYNEVECPEGSEVNVLFNYDAALTNGIEATSINWTIGSSTAEGETIETILSINTPVLVKIEVQYANMCLEVYEEEIVLGPYASIDFGDDTIGVCPLDPTTIVLNPNPDFTYTWSPTEGLDLTDPSNPIVTISENMTYNVIVTDGLCVIEESIYVKILDDLKIEITGDTLSCNGEVELMASGAVGAGIYEWSDDTDFGNIIATGQNLQDVLTEDAKRYYVRWISDFCQAQSADVMVTSEGNVDLLGDPTQSVCAGLETIIVPSVTEGLTFEWKNEAGEILSTSSTLAITVDDMATIYISAINEKGCVFADTLLLQAIDASPMLLLATPFEACVGDQFFLPVTNPNDGMEVTVAWTENAHIIDGLDSINPTIVIGADETDSFELAYTVTSELGCAVQGVFSIGIAQSPPDVSWTYTMEDCYNFKVCFKVDGDYKGELLWDFGDPTTERDVSKSADVCYTYPVAGEYTIVLSNNSDICQFDDLSQTILLRTIGDPVSVDIIEECLGEEMTVSPSEIIDGLTYVWTDEDGNEVGDGPDLNIIVEKDTKYLLTATDLNGCIYLDSVKVFGIDEFPEFLTVEPYEVCYGDTIELSIFNENPDHDITILWEAHPFIVGPLDVLTPMIGVPMEDMDPFQLVYTAMTQFGCEITDTIDFIVGEQSVVDISYEVENCDDYTVCFKVDGDFNGFAIWNFGDETTNSDVSFLPEDCYTYPGPGTYTIELINRGFCAFSPVAKTITLNDSILIFGLDDTSIICGAVEAMISVPDHISGSTVEWLDANGNSLGSAESITVNIEGPTFVGLTVYDENNCPFTDTLNLEPFMFDYVLNAPDVFCLDTEIEAEVIVEGDVEYQYEWGPAECIISGGNTSSVVIDVTLEKDVFVTVTHPVLGCVLTETITIDPQSLVFDADASPDSEINLGENVDVFVVDPESDWAYEWSNGSNEGTQTVSPTETTIYMVTVTDENGCTGIAEVEIRVLPPDCEEDIFIPTAFSPNGDNNNDILYVRSNFIEAMTLIVYDRWGEEVFTSNNVSNGWDGRHNGAELSPDVFAYYLTARCTDGTDIIRRGNVSLLR